MVIWLKTDRFETNKLLLEISETNRCFSSQINLLNSHFIGESACSKFDDVKIFLVIGNVVILSTILQDEFRIHFRARRLAFQNVRLPINSSVKG